MPEGEVQLPPKDTVVNPDKAKAKSQPAITEPALNKISNYAYSSAAGNNASGNKEKGKNSKKATLTHSQTLPPRKTLATVSPQTVKKQPIVPKQTTLTD